MQVLGVLLNGSPIYVLNAMCYRPTLKGLPLNPLEGEGNFTATCLKLRQPSEFPEGPIDRGEQTR